MSTFHAACAMPFSQLKYSEKKAEKDALFSLLDEYFQSRRKSGPQPPATVIPELQTNKQTDGPSRQSLGLPEKKTKPPIPSPRKVEPSPPINPTPIPPTLPRGPPVVNRNTRPALSKQDVYPSPPPLWGDILSRFEYPPPDHSSPGIDLFDKYIAYPINELHSAAIAIFGILYPEKTFTPKLVQSPVNLVMRDMDGVAHAANSYSFSGPWVSQASRNVTHKSDFVFSTQYLSKLNTHSDPAFEIRGIIYHELTHTFQYSAENTPGGLIEGIADFVRLRGNFAAKHWTESPEGKKWDQGYETTAYFLDWADKSIYPGFVAYVNQWLGNNKTYHEQTMFDDIMPGWSWSILWEQYLTSRQ